MISQIEFARQITETAEPTIFDKSFWRIIPSCSRRYGDGIFWVKFYCEFYNLDILADSNVAINFEVRDKKNKVVKSGSVVQEKKQARVLIDSLNLENLRPGPYELVIYTFDNEGDVISRSGSFSVTWTSLELVKNDFEGAIEQLRYIASSKEVNRLKNAPKEERMKEWNKFWKSKDPTPDTDVNEVEDEYYARIAYSNRHYEIPYKEGWRTDMGMIHIINGKPDDIESHPFDLETKPYEIWYYYYPRRRFLFIDDGGYGEYVLQYPYDGDVNKQINVRGGGP
jgi:GWxTD domain-containing protein